MDLSKIRMLASPLASIFGFESWLLQPAVVQEFMPIVILIILISVYDWCALGREGIAGIKSSVETFVSGGRYQPVFDWTVVDSARPL